MSLVLALALAVSLLCGFSVFAADSTGYPPVTMDTIIDEDYYGKQYIYENAVCQQTLLSMPVRDLFATGCVGSAESSGWLAFDPNNERGQLTDKMKPYGKYIYEYNGQIVDGWELKDGVCIFRERNSAGLDNWAIPIKALPLRGNPYIKTIIMPNARYNGYDNSACKYISKDYYPNLETVIAFGGTLKIDGVTTISTQPTRDYHFDKTHDITISFNDGTSVSDVVLEGTHIDTQSPLYDAFGKLHIVINQATLNKLDTDKNRLKAQAFDSFKDL